MNRNNYRKYDMNSFDSFIFREIPSIVKTKRNERTILIPNIFIDIQHQLTFYLKEQTSQINSQEFKLADFGFAKKNSEIGGTIIGAAYYMSPETFSNYIYSYQVDMWAFAVMFYFMLNMEYPFRFNFHFPTEQQRLDLIQQATNFSYKASVEKSKKKLLDNCNEDVEDLFSRMFDLNPKKRITFSQIKKHQVFKQYFPDAIQYYNEDIIIPSLHNSKVSTSKQKSLLQAKYDKILFLEQVSKEFSGSLDFIDDAQITALTQNLFKYHIKLLRNFYEILKPIALQHAYPGLKWKQYSQNPQFLVLKNRIRQKLDNVQLVLEKQMADNEFSGAFKKSYRSSTSYVYEILRKKFGDGNKFVYSTVLVVICHTFNNLIECCDEQLEKLFPDFAKERKNKDHISFRELKNWMSTSSKQKLKTVIKNILSTFFSG